MSPAHHQKVKVTQLFLDLQTLDKICADSFICARLCCTRTRIKHTLSVVCFLLVPIKRITVRLSYKHCTCFTKTETLLGVPSFQLLFRPFKFWFILHNANFFINLISFVMWCYCDYLYSAEPMLIDVYLYLISSMWMLFLNLCLAMMPSLREISFMIICLGICN